MNLIVPFTPHPKERISVALGGQPLFRRYSTPGLLEWNPAGNDTGNAGTLESDSHALQVNACAIHLEGAVNVLVCLAYNSHLHASIKRTQNLRLLHAESAEWCAVFAFAVSNPNCEWLLDFDQPRHHSHGWLLCRLRGDAHTSRLCSHERDSERDDRSEVWSSYRRMLSRRR